MPATLHGKERVLLLAGGMVRPPHGGLLSLDPETGKIDDSFPWRSRNFASVLAASPVVIDNGVFITEDYGEGGAFVRIGETLQEVQAGWSPGPGVVVLWSSERDLPLTDDSLRRYLHLTLLPDNNKNKRTCRLFTNKQIT